MKKRLLDAFFMLKCKNSCCFLSDFIFAIIYEFSIRQRPFFPFFS